MSNPLHPCPACQRHVFADACECPFCGAKLSPATCAKLPTPPPNYRGMSRAARIAVGASLVGAAACFRAGSAYGAAYVEDAKADAPRDAATDGVGGSTSGGEGGLPPLGSGGQGGSAPIDGGSPPGNTNPDGQ